MANRKVINDSAVIVDKHLERRIKTDDCFLRLQIEISPWHNHYLIIKLTWYNLAVSSSDMRYGCFAIDGHLVEFKLVEGYE